MVADYTKPPKRPREEKMINTIKAVKCQTCKKIHELDSENFLSVHGNVNVGMSGGIIGNNIDENGKINRVSIYCIECFNKRIRENTTKVTTRILHDIEWDLTRGLGKIV